MKRDTWTDWISRLLTVTITVAGSAVARPVRAQEWSASNTNTARPIVVPEQWQHSPSARAGSRVFNTTPTPPLGRQSAQPISLPTAQPNSVPLSSSLPSFKKPQSQNLPAAASRQTSPNQVPSDRIPASVPPAYSPFNMPPQFSSTSTTAPFANVPVPNSAFNAPPPTQRVSDRIQWSQFPENPGQFSNLLPASSEQRSAYSPTAVRTSSEIEDAIVINTFNEVTPRSRVAANKSREPQSKPVTRIQQVHCESCPNPEDAGAIPAESLIEPFAQRATSYPTKVELPVQPGQLTELPKDFAPWWDAAINRPLRANTKNMDVDAETLVLKAIEHSPQVIAMRIDPIIRETMIFEEQANFDWVSFLDTTYDNKNDPIGSVLTAGPGRTRYLNSQLQSRAGLRKNLTNGGKFDVAQRIGYQDTNSAFFRPNNQGTSRIEMNFTQPLLRGGGETVAQSRIVLAALDTEVSSAELLIDMQQHLVSVYESYWTLYRARANRLQKERLLQRAVKTQKMLEDRQGVDSIRRQILRAQAAVASRRAEIVRSETAIRNAESRLRLLVNSPELKDRTQIELLPSELPMSEELDITLRGSVETALTHRPDIFSAIQRLKAESLRLEVAKNEVLPKLDLLLGTYVSGLRGSGDINQAWVQPFQTGQPGYNIGLTFEMPLGNRAAKARQSRRQWELAKALKLFEASVETAMTEVEIAVRETETAYQEMLGHFQAMIAAENEAQYLEERWKLIPGNDQTISFLLEDLLDAQERVATEEGDYTASQVAYVLSVVGLKRATGILLSVDQEGAAQIAPAQNPKAIINSVPTTTPIPAIPPAPEPLRFLNQ